MSAPHERLTDYEQIDRALRLASILMRPTSFPVGLNIGLPPLPVLKEARRRMVEARWDDAVPWLDRPLTRLEEYAKERSSIDEAIAAGRVADDKWVSEMAKYAEVSVPGWTTATTDENGNYYLVRYWFRDEDSPWRRIAVPAYRAIIKDMAVSDPGRAEMLREKAARLWDLMTPEERVSAA